MPILKPCSHPGCRALVSAPASRCTVHARARDTARGTAIERGYGHAWSQYSAARLARLPLCGQRESGELDRTWSRCVRAGRLTPATCTDHIVPMSAGGSKWSTSNHQSLCAACNVAKGDRLTPDDDDTGGGIDL